MPRNSSTGFINSFFAVITGFALIWHIWWMVVLGVLGAFVTVLFFTFREKEEVEISAEELAQFDREHWTEFAI
jgi:cytochrome o ubiquinol oxidase subunit 1